MSTDADPDRGSLQKLLRVLSFEAPNTAAWGHAFECVSDLALLSSPEFGAQIRKIWRWEDWPGARGRDLGIDRVVSTIDGQLWAIQAKGLEESSSLKYSGKGGIATFLAAAATDPFTLRLIVTSTDVISSNARKIAAEQTVPTRILDRSWLDSLDIEWPADLNGLRTLLRDTTSSLGFGERMRAEKRYLLQPHQKAAVADILTSFAEQAQHTNDARAILLMPCGTGKTLTCHAVAEELGAVRVLVLVPSLALLAQTMRVWQTQSMGRLHAIAVCSDETVVSRGEDEIVMDPSELLAPVTTDPEVLASSLATMSGISHSTSWPTVVFSTYHSCPVVAAAQKLEDQTRSRPFDLMIADEAHYLAGNVSSAFATALDASRIHARHRLFSTATPRIVSTALKDTLAKDGGDHGVISMDNTDVFGPIAHQLSFSAALADGLLSDYQVVILGVDDAEVTRMIDRRELLRLEGDADVKTDSATLAAAIAVYRSVAEHGATRMVSYHSRIARAERFARLLTYLSEWLPSDMTTTKISAHVVTGDMPAGRRRAILKRLSLETVNSEIVSASLVSNARCLNEGVDIPTLDGVIFADPRKSRIDVVQAVGRAIRLSESKTRGLIILPVPLNESEDAEKAIGSSAFACVWDVLGALRDHDDALADELDTLRTELGRTGTIPHNALTKIRFDLPSRVDPEFSQNIRLALVERTTSSFYYNLGLLQAYVDREGHARVPTSHQEQDINLGRWVTVQRKNKDWLDAERRDLLENLPGWCWDARAAMWEDKLSVLRKFVEVEGHARVPQGFVVDGVNLGSWVLEQRNNEGKLSDYRRDQLASLAGWTWNPHADRWEAGYAALKLFIGRTGHSRVPKVHFEEGINLGSWVGEQRLNQDCMSNERRVRLNGLNGWVWDVRADAISEHLSALEEFMNREGHARVPVNCFINGINLGQWCRLRRKNREKIDAELRDYLNSLPGWTWDLQASVWDAGYAALESFVSQRGDSRVPTKYMVSTPYMKDMNLGQWVREQRRTREKMSDERRARLDAIPEWTW